MVRDSVVAVGAHPDDVILGFGGTLARLAERGLRVTVVALTSGELAGDPRVREGEERRACERLGASVVFGRLPDGGIAQRAAMDVIERVVRGVEPSYVFVNDPNDRHQDHVATSRATLAATRHLPNILFYEGPSTEHFAPTCTVDVSATWQRKLDALAMHESQLVSGTLARWVDATARYRAVQVPDAATCEAFRVHRVDLPLFAAAGSRLSVSVVAGDISVPTLSGGERDPVR